MPRDLHLDFSPFAVVIKIFFKFDVFAFVTFFKRELIDSDTFVENHVGEASVLVPLRHRLSFRLLESIQVRFFFFLEFLHQWWNICISHPCCRWNDTNKQLPIPAFLFLIVRSFSFKRRCDGLQDGGREMRLGPWMLSLGGQRHAFRLRRHLGLLLRPLRLSLQHDGRLLRANGLRRIAQVLRVLTICQRRRPGVE